MGDMRDLVSELGARSYRGRVICRTRRWLQRPAFPGHVVRGRHGGRLGPRNSLGRRTQRGRSGDEVNTHGSALAAANRDAGQGDRSALPAPTWRARLDAAVATRKAAD